MVVVRVPVGNGMMVVMGGGKVLKAGDVKVARDAYRVVVAVAVGMGNVDGKEMEMGTGTEVVKGVEKAAGIVVGVDDAVLVVGHIVAEGDGVVVVVDVKEEMASPAHTVVEERQ
ncbi:hypothetical protein SAY87_016670 [Trapa incisa]|uniref:Uncharacterized protein n=1 Tax=Trapa incisa TaxID=236973 RepID=A0AAN7L9N5_9MYRT|nr:hypothetical protein SAY87_016670 [Trapa incisa]